MSNKTAQIKIYVPPEVREKWEAIWQKEAPLIPFSTWLAEMLRRGVEMQQEEKMMLEKMRQKGDTAPAANA